MSPCYRFIPPGNQYMVKPQSLLDLSLENTTTESQMTQTTKPAGFLTYMSFPDEFNREHTFGQLKKKHPFLPPTKTMEILITDIIVCPDQKVKVRLARIAK